MKKDEAKRTIADVIAELIYEINDNDPETQSPARIRELKEELNEALNIKAISGGVF